MSSKKVNNRPSKTLTFGPLPTPYKWAFSYRNVTTFAMLLDAVLIFGAGTLSGVAYHLYVFGSAINVGQAGEFAATVAILFAVFGRNYGLYDFARLMNLKSQVRQIVTLWIFLFLVLTMVAFVLKAGDNYSRGATLLFALTGAPMLVAGRSALRALLTNSTTLYFAGRKVIVIADRARAHNAKALDLLKRHGMEIFDYILLPISDGASDLNHVMGHAIKGIRGSAVEEIVVCADLANWSNLKNSLSELRVLPLPVHFIPSGTASELLKFQYHTMDGTTVIELQRAPRTTLEQATIRAFDIIVAGTALVLLLPLLLLTSVAIALDSPGAIIFRQRRRGFNGTTFEIFKFRTMSVVENGDFIIQAQPNDHRVTNVGHWLRRTSIDELPQLLNVLKGEMSIVGPRPHAVAHDNEFDRVVDKYAFRHHVKPGLTGLAQVNGCRGQTNTVEDIKKRVEFDLWYIDNWSPVLDLKIVFWTVAEVVRGHNAY